VGTPRIIGQKQKDRVSICRENLEKINDGTLRLCEIVTGDESWFFHRHIRKKQSNMSWVAIGQPPRTVVRQNIFGPKNMFCIFFKSNGMVLCTYIDKGKTIDSDSYIEDCLKPMIESIKWQRTASGLKRIHLLHDNARPHVSKKVKNICQY